MKISDLVNKVEPFRFEYDGFVLEGEYWKYKTTTPTYAKQATASLPKVPEKGTEEEIAIAREVYIKALERVGSQSLADTIKSWNAKGDEGELLPITIETFEQLPQPFIDTFLGFLRELRMATAEKKESTTSPSG